MVYPQEIEMKQVTVQIECCAWKAGDCHDTNLVHSNLYLPVIWPGMPSSW